jgi:hypothetical protein
LAVLALVPAVIQIVFACVMDAERLSPAEASRRLAAAGQVDQLTALDARRSPHCGTGQLSVVAAPGATPVAPGVHRGFAIDSGCASASSPRNR